MSFPLSSQLLSDDDICYDADDFDLDFDADYEFLSDAEFEVTIDENDYDSDDLDVFNEDFCLDDADGFDNFDSSENAPEEQGYADEAP